MTSTQQAQSKPADKDYSAYTWIPGVNEKFSSACVIERKEEDGAMIFVRGYSKKLNKNTTNSGHYDYEALHNLWKQIGAILGYPTEA